jgi:16S rRNA (guanine527-N7)-methyltransferase
LDAIAPIDRIPSGGRILDVGTGAGFPGIPIKILRPMVSMTLIDSSRKKINFIRHLIRQLDLKHVDARQTRIEAFVRGLWPPNHFEVIVSRAVTNIVGLTHLVMPLLRSGAALWLWKGPDIEEELRALDEVPEVRQGTLRVHVHPYQLPIVDVGRNLVRVEFNVSGAE